MFKPDIDRNALQNLLAKVKTNRELDEFRDSASEKSLENFGVCKIKKDKECKDGNCQKIISEGELSEYLAKQWKVVTVLLSGNLVITNE